VKALLLLALLQAAPTPARAPAPAPVVEPWKGSLAEGLAEMERLSAAGKTDESLAVAESLLAPDAFERWRASATAQPGWKRTAVEAAGPLFGAFGFAARSDAERATVHHARGVVLAAAEGQRTAAADAFERARALAGPGELRLDATYDAGWTWLAEGEAQRAKLPEISGSAPSAPAPGGTPPAGAAPATGAAPPEPDPLPLARAAYLQASERFVDRVKLDPSDADTRANLELVHRRLRELAEIQKKREEEKKKQEQQQKDQEKKDQDSKDQQKDGEKKDDEKNPDSKPQEKKDDKKDPADPKPDAKPPKDQESPPQQPEQPTDPKDPKKASKPKAGQEELLTREEVMRLLDILKDREEEGKKILEQLRAARRVSVKKDW